MPFHVWRGLALFGAVALVVRLTGCNTCKQEDLNEGGTIRKCFVDKTAYVANFNLDTQLIKDCDEGKWHDNNREELEIEQQSEGVPGGIAGGENQRRRNPVCNAAMEALACFNAECCDLVLPVQNADEIDHKDLTNNEMMNSQNFVQSNNKDQPSGPKVRVYTACLKLKAEDAIASEYYRDCVTQNNGDVKCKGQDCEIVDPCESWLR